LNQIKTKIKMHQNDHQNGWHAIEKDPKNAPFEWHM
jgi:hypothetical protein